ncbi:50S ribosomal protein L9 [Microbacterium sp. NE2HP2]|jgi:large subunit ribosomal protein L9|uniref:Large ribosomal subunit protein bL9 n=4 Tax=Microbacterium TaxID=33882 RepID=A0A9W6HHP9_9MICO|nr:MULTISPECIES: 50S ribosomal protein L9 [Microbacterium]APF34717.1 50S ribosomal protein L9 [Microbacterium paludicola]MBP2420997.1 large subunit ribosomal protein L9 [Microbacterium imperiale]MCZ4068731.1 50S ribosomal protein L9 [Microbacterium sp. H37-C3]MDD7945451.1 50S ribosomal protein L9 [Microbacterium plantarum]MDQ1217794.1 large subunit ribosomal protein L9 [Microbacterium arborescens]
MAKLILTNEVAGLGSAGDVIEVKNGYARNYLIPQGFAVAWTRGGEKQVASIRAARDARAIHDHEEAVALKNNLESNKVKLSVKAGAEGRLFGAVKPADVADAVKTAGLGDLDKRKIHITSPIKAVGEHEATIRLRDDLTAVITLQVVAAK